MNIAKALRNIPLSLHPGQYREIVDEEEGGVGEAVFAILLSCFLAIAVFIVLHGLALGSGLIVSTLALAAAAVVALSIKSLGTSWAYSKFSSSKKPVNPGKLLYLLSLPFSALLILIAVVFSFLPMEPLYLWILVLLGVFYYEILAFGASLPDGFNVGLTMGSLPLNLTLGFFDLAALLVICAGMFGAAILVGT